MRVAAHISSQLMMQINTYCEFRCCIGIALAQCSHAQCRRSICRRHIGCGGCRLCVDCTRLHCGALSTEEDHSPATGDEGGGPRYRLSQKARVLHHAWPVIDL